MPAHKKRKESVILLAKAPLKGRVKTRLAAKVGSEKATQIYEELLKKTIRTIQKLKKKDVFIFYTPKGHKHFFSSYGRCFLQRGNNLGERMYNAIKRVFSLGYSRIVLIGSDIPGLKEELIEQAFNLLEINDIVIGPTEDGGYYLIAMKRPYRLVFKDIPWSTEQTFQVTVKRANSRGLRVGYTDTLVDIDTLTDYLRLKAEGVL